MESYVYSNPYVHTVYYFRPLFDPAKPRDTKAIEELLLQAQGYRVLRGFQEDFAFNENVGCTSAANGTFMRLNACSLLKLHHWCLYPTDRTPKKVAQYVARIFISPLAATLDLVTNVSLLALKLSAWPIMRFNVESDSLSKKCLNANVAFQTRAAYASFLNVVLSCIGSVTWSWAGPHRASTFDMELWGYLVHQYQGPNIPQKRNTPFYGFGSAVAYNDAVHLYAPWFKDSQEEVILDPKRVKYLKEYCGWSDFSDTQLKDMGIKFSGFEGTSVAYNIDQKMLKLILMGKNIVRFEIQQIPHTLFTL